MNYRVIGKIVMAYKPKATKDFEKKFSKYIKEEMKKQGWEKPPIGKFVRMNAIFYFPRVDMDAQNYFKSLCDIMTQAEVYEDDNIVMEHVDRIYYDSENPRIEIVLSVAEFIGIFDNRNELDQFVNTYCKNCKKGNKIGQKGGCSIYKNALENRIKPEIIKDGQDKWQCTKIKNIKNK